MVTPVRFTSGIVQDAVWQPLAHMGQPDPFFYNTWSQDFDMPYPTGAVTSTLGGGGTVALTAGDGGLELFTTNASTPLVTDYVSQQSAVASFALIPATSTVAGKKTFFLCRMNLSDVTNAAFIQGLVAPNTTPFTSIADGIYFSKVTGSTTINLTSVVGSVATTVAIPTAAITLANNAYFDLGFYVTQQGTINVYANNNSVGYIPQSGTGATTPNRGAVAAITPAALTAVVLAPLSGVQSGTATSKTMTMDYLLVARER
jgi:hypothetical protein